MSTDSIIIERILNGYVVHYATGFGSRSTRCTSTLPQALALIAEFYGDLKVGERVAIPNLVIEVDSNKLREYREAPL